MGYRPKIIEIIIDIINITSSSSEAFQNHQKLDSLRPFPSFTAYFTNSISQIIIHPKNMQVMEHLVFFLLSWVLQLAIFQI